ncbi:MAG: hypothetical protein FWC97_12275, partial [Treponema sp.]|nr:hypothetical protein [Treponema sp.]
ALIQEQRNSGKSRERWCDENNINHKSMGSAVKRYANRLENINNRQEICESKPLNNKEIFGEPFLKSDNPNCRAEQFCEQTKGVRNAEQTTKPSWIEIGIESEMNQEKAYRLEEPDSRERTQRVCEMISKTSEHHKPQAEIEEKKSKIKIRFGKLEIEADDGYPSSHLENLIGLVIRLTADCSPLQSGKLVAVC